MCFDHLDNFVKLKDIHCNCVGDGTSRVEYVKLECIRNTSCTGIEVVETRNNLYDRVCMAIVCSSRAPKNSNNITTVLHKKNEGHGK